MRLIVQPDDGTRLLIEGITKAKRNIQIVVFRFDQREIERALANAVTRGVAVHALIAHTNRAGEEALRRLEMRLLAAGATVARTADDLVRYHGKMMVVDGRDLYLLAFNWTHADIERSRSFGVVVRRPALVHEAERLFEADTKRHSFEPRSNSLVVSPVNARALLEGFIKGAKKRLFIYDPKISDPAMIGLLEARSRAGVDIRILGRLTRKSSGLAVRKLVPMRLHTRTMVRDDAMAFMGSQSLRALELDARREIGVIFRDSSIVAKLARTFAHDWEMSAAGAEADTTEAPADRVGKKVAKLIAKNLPRVTPVLNGVVKDVVGDTVEVQLDSAEFEEAVKGAVKKAIKGVVSDMVGVAVDGEPE